MTSKYKIIHNGRTIALIYVSPHPAFSGHKIGTIVPIQRQGRWVDNTAALVVENPIHDIFPMTLDNEKLAEDLVKQAGIQWSQINFVEDEIIRA
jgi:hypothetical protein